MEVGGVEAGEGGVNFGAVDGRVGVGYLGGDGGWEVGFGGVEVG